MQITINLPNATDIMTKGDYTEIRLVSSRYEAEAEATKDAECCASEIEKEWFGRKSCKSGLKDKHRNANLKAKHRKAELESAYNVSDKTEGQYRDGNPFNKGEKGRQCSKRIDKKRSRQKAAKQIHAYTNADELALAFLEELYEVANILGQEVGELYE